MINSTNKFFDNYVKNYSDWFIKDDEWGWKDDFLVDEVKRDILGDKWGLYKSQLTNELIYNSDGNKIKKDNNNKENKNNMNNDFGFSKIFGKMFSPVAHGYAKMGVNGQVAIRVGDTYKTYDIKKGRLVDCDNFAFDMDGMFWVVPTFKVECGDIIMVNGRPRCVIEVKEKTIKTFSYENSTIDEIVPEHHVFMGKTYCYGKIFSPFMNMDKSDNMMSNMMQMAMMSQMFGGNNNGFMGMNPMAMMFMMNNKNGNMFEDMFAGAFNFGEDNTTALDKEDK